MPGLQTTPIRLATDLTFPVLQRKQSTLSQLLGYYFGICSRQQNGFMSENINSAWTAFDDPAVTYKPGIETCVESLHKDQTPFVFNIHAYEEDNAGTKNKFIQFSLWHHKNNAIRESSFEQLAGYKVALYDHTTGKISAQKSLEKTEQNSFLEAIINQSDCNQEIDAGFKAVIDENFPVDQSLTYRYSILFFDKEGNLIVPSKK